MSDACRGADVALGLDLEKLGVCCFLTQADMETQTVLEVEDWTSHALCTSLSLSAGQVYDGDPLPFGACWRQHTLRLDE